MTGNEIEIFGQLILAIVLGSLVGLERELSKKSAGMRTFALVSLGASFFTIISILAMETFSDSNFELSRIPSQIVVGVGFIGAGLIIFQRSQLKGLTTAAGLWVAAAVGMAIGFKFYLLALFATFLTVLILVFFWFLERKIVKKLVTELPIEEEEY
ncbi:MgtC/SapB family protein [Candidatus Wolfebacteria bacterium]|nr:MgtC/SapB family protein [Candidatus Wolfebacteria bacterium]